MKFRDEKNRNTIWYFLAIGIAMAILHTGLDAVKSAPASVEDFLQGLAFYLISSSLATLLLWFLYSRWMNKKAQQ